MDLAGWALQLVTFASGAVTGGLVVYWTLRRRDRGKAQPMTKPASDRTVVAFVIIGLSVLLVVFGLQTRASNAQDDKQRARDAATTAADRARDQCLNDYAVAVGVYLTNTLNTRVVANDKLAKAAKALTVAQLAKDAANDQVVEVVAGSLVDDPPTTTNRDFVAALEKFRDAKADLVRATVTYEKVERDTKDTLDMTGSDAKPYDPPKVDCAP